VSNSIQTQLSGPPKWADRYLLLEFVPRKGSEIADLLTEIYAAVNGGQHRLAAMGIRALLERVMINKVGDQGTFRGNLDELDAVERVIRRPA
jgi:hypothetical protein